MHSRKYLQILFMAAVMLGFFSCAALAAEDSATLAIMIGTVEVSPAGSGIWTEATEGMKLFGGDRIRSGEDGMLSLLFSNGSIVSLKANSEFEIESLNITKKGDEIGDVAYKLNLTRGKLKAIVEKLGDESSFEIKTPTAVAAVRGTTFYLTVRELTQEELPPEVLELLVTELFVEYGGVLYTNTLSGKFYSVTANQTSGAFEDGGLTVPIEIPEDKIQEWIEGWDDILVAEPYQTAGDTDPNLTGTGAGGTETGGGERESNQFRQVLEEIYVQDEADLIWEEMAARLVEREFLRNQIRGILEANRERRVIGYMEKISDAQAGKVMTDVSGNRVRMEQYVLRPGSNVVELLNVNLRGGATGGDLTTMQWITTFNNSLDALQTGQLKNLPWNDYLDTRFAEDGTPLYIHSPSQETGIYPTGMEVKLSHGPDFFAESRQYDLPRINNYGGRVYTGGIQLISSPELLISNFNDNQPMPYQTAVEEIQPKGTFSTAPVFGALPGDPKGFQYKFANAAGGEGTIEASFYVLSNPSVSNPSVRQEGYSSVSFNNIWDALRVNMRGSGKDIGNNNLEMRFLSSAAIFPGGAIDLIYVPFNDMLWKDDAHVPDYSLPVTEATP